MILLIDLGNTRVKWACLTGAQLAPGTPFSSVYARLVNDLNLAWLDLARPTSIFGCCVADRATRAELDGWTRRHWALSVHWVESRAAQYGVTNGYADSATLGVDRWVALVAARSLYSVPVCVADCGTALTVDVLDGTGRHLGGVIAPGLSAMRRALPLSCDPAEDFAGTLGCTTAAGVQAGLRHAAAGLIERVYAASGAETLLLTGGDAPQLRPTLTVTHHHEPDLLLKGLARLAFPEDHRP